MMDIFSMPSLEGNHRQSPYRAGSNHPFNVWLRVWRLIGNEYKQRLIAQPDKIARGGGEDGAQAGQRVRMLLFGQRAQPAVQPDEPAVQRDGAGKAHERFARAENHPLRLDQRADGAGRAVIAQPVAQRDALSRAQERGEIQWTFLPIRTNAGSADSRSTGSCRSRTAHASARTARRAER